MMVPSKIEFPIESTPSHIAGGYVLEGIVTYDINYRANDGSPVLGYSRQKWLEPSFCALAMSIEERYHLSFYMLRSQ